VVDQMTEGQKDRLHDVLDGDLQLSDADAGSVTGGAIMANFGDGPAPVGGPPKPPEPLPGKFKDLSVTPPASGPVGPPDVQVKAVTRFSAGR
jgi:hypothetical protein